MPASSITTFVLHAAAEGDFDNDGSVDGADLGAWTAGLGMDAGATLADGDWDGDHDVDGGDFLAWQRGYGKTPTNVAAVPEPGTILLILPALVVLRRVGNASQWLRRWTN